MNNGRYKLNYYLVIALMMIGGCTPDPLEVNNIPVLQPHIVVSAQVVPDQSIAVLLTKSIGALDAGDSSDAQNLLARVLVTDATVTIDHDGKHDTLIYLGDGVYGSVNIPIISGHTYILNATSPTVGSITSATQAQEIVKFQDVNAALYKDEYDTTAFVDYSLMDLPGKNFYMINVQRISTRKDLNDLLNPRLFTQVMTDDHFNGQLFKEEFKVLFQRYWPDDTVAVSLTNISGDYYQYVKRRIDNRFSAISFATEPFNYPTNVKGGYGFFNIQQPDVRVFVLE